MRTAGMLLLLLSVLLVTGLAVAVGHGPANSEMEGFAAVLPIEDWFTADDAVELTEETKIEIKEEVADVSPIAAAGLNYQTTPVAPPVLLGEIWAATAAPSRRWYDPNIEYHPLL